MENLSYLNYRIESSKNESSQRHWEKRNLGEMTDNGEWREKEGLVCSTEIRPKSLDFESITNQLTVQAKRVLKHLAIRDVGALLRLTRDDLILVWGRSEGAIAEIEGLQAKLWTQNEQEAVQPPADEMDFESITNELTVRAKRVLKDLAIEDVGALVRLTRDDLRMVWGCGEKIIAEIEGLQGKLRTQNEQENVQTTADEKDFDNAPKEVFDAVWQVLSVRGKHVLQNLHIDSLAAFMELDRVRLLKCRNCGRKTADEIVQLQAEHRPETKYFKSATNELTAQAKRVLKDLAIEDIGALVRLTRDDLRMVWGCGEKIIAEIEGLQGKLRTQNEQEDVQTTADEKDFHNAPKEVFDAVCRALSIRARHALQNLRIDSLAAFMELDEPRLFKCRNCGPQDRR